MPPKVLPGSIPPSARKNRPRASREMTRNTSPGNSAPPAQGSRGTNAAAATDEPNTTKGAAEKTQDARSERTTSLRKSLRKSRYSWSRGGPCRF